MANEINLQMLKQITNTILDHVIDDLKMDVVSLDDAQDFYWNVPESQLYAVKLDQPQLDIGRLSDDWDFLSEIKGDKEQAAAIMLVHLAPILRYIGEKVGR